MAKSKSARTRRDRWSDWAVVVVLALALLAGWAVMAAAQGQRATFSDAATGLTLEYPRGWMLKQREGVVFQAVDPASPGPKTTYEVRIVPIDTTSPVSATLASALNDASLWRAQEGSAYRLFDITEGQVIQGQPTGEATYVYVVEGSDFFVQRMPEIVRGLDVAVPHGDRAYLFSLLASEGVFDSSVPAFREFVQRASSK